MANFAYKMQNILNIKEKIEEQKRNELGQAMVIYQNEMDYQYELESSLKENVDAFRNGHRQQHAVSEFQRLNNNVKYYEDTLKVQKLVAARALSVVEQKREALKVALMEKQIQEKLKERAYEVFYEEEKDKELKILDEIVSFRYSSDDRE